MKTIEVLAGDDFDKKLQEAQELAISIGNSVRLEFNGVVSIVDANTDIGQTTNSYKQVLGRVQDHYRTIGEGSIRNYDHSKNLGDYIQF